jgi:hypothetical protein
VRGRGRDRAGQAARPDALDPQAQARLDRELAKL